MQHTDTRTHTLQQLVYSDFTISKYTNIIKDLHFSVIRKNQKFSCQPIEDLMQNFWILCTLLVVCFKVQTIQENWQTDIKDPSRTKYQIRKLFNRTLNRLKIISYTSPHWLHSWAFTCNFYKLANTFYKCYLQNVLKINLISISRLIC